MEEGQESEALREKIKSSLTSGSLPIFLRYSHLSFARELCIITINLSSLELVGVCSLLPKGPNLE